MTGGVIGALVGSGISKEDADVYAEAVRRGEALVVARVSDGDAGRYKAVLDRSGVDIVARANAYRAAGWKGFDPAAAPYTAEEVRRDRELYR